MVQTNIDRGWSFGKSEEHPLAALMGRDDAKREVNLPHDFMIEADVSPDAPAGSMTGYYPGGVGIYTKMLDIPAEYEGSRVLLQVDGCYMNSTIELNGSQLYCQHYGYAPFHVDLTPHLKYGGKNRLKITVSNGAQPNARWYSGAGLYRHVDLLVSPMTHIAPWGIYAYTTNIINGTAFITAEVTVENHTSKAKKVRVDVTLSAKNSYGKGYGIAWLPANEKGIARVKIAVPNAELWDIDSPLLYDVNAELSEDEIVIDTAATTFGVRTISADSTNGFMLNGRTVNMIGGCVHHDNGILGSASFYDSEYRKMKIHKDNGYNAIRCAHNPPSRDMLDACDRLGLLVIDEAFDEWNMGKRPYGYSLSFASDWEKDLTNLMTRDRNHPCIIMWSTGNEITERAGLGNGYEWAAKLANKTRELDPTRPIMNALCSFFNGLDDDNTEKFYAELIKNRAQMGSTINLDTGYGNEIWAPLTEAFAAPLDIVGYNYQEHRYERDHEQYPDRVMCCTELKPLDSAKYWAAVEKHPFLIGDFLWTSADYLGEAGLGKTEYFDTEEQAKDFFLGSFPWRTSNDADFDLCGFIRPQHMYRRIVWGAKDTFIASRNPANTGKIEKLGRWGWPECENSWSWPGFEGKAVQVDVYSAGDEVELILNGKSMGRKPVGESFEFTATFELNYIPGTLEAISYLVGAEISRDCIKTVGAPAGVKITPEKTEILADGQSLCFTVVEIVDENGNLVPTAEIKAKAKVCGAGTLAAFGAGTPATTENYTKGEFTSFKGRLLAILRSGYESGSVTLTVEVEGLAAVTVEIKVK